MTISPRGKLRDLRELGDADDRPLSSASWQVPSTVRLEEGCLVAPTDQRWHSPDHRLNLLEGFIRLGDANDDQIAQYATRAGLLYLCNEHLLPASHMHSFVGGPALPSYWTCDAMGVATRGAYVAPLSAWRFWSRQAFAILRIASRLKVNEPADAADWQTISDEGVSLWRREIRDQLRSSALLRGCVAGAQGIEHYGEHLVSWPPGTREVLQRKAWTLALQSERLDLGIAVSTWLFIARVGFELTWRDEHPRARLSGGGLFGTIGIQLMLVVSGSKGIGICSSCAVPYVPSRRLDPRRRNYCESCGRSAAVRDAAAAYRERKRSQGRKQ